MKKKNADRILQVIQPHMEHLGLQYAEAVPIDFLSKDVFLELGTKAPILPTALQKHMNNTYQDNQILQVSKKNLFDIVNQFTDSPLRYDGSDEEQIKLSLCPILG